MLHKPDTGLSVHEHKFVDSFSTLTNDGNPEQWSVKSNRAEKKTEHMVSSHMAMMLQFTQPFWSIVDAQYARQLAFWRFCPYFRVYKIIKLFVL